MPSFCNDVNNVSVVTKGIISEVSISSIPSNSSTNLSAARGTATFSTIWSFNKDLTILSNELTKLGSSITFNGFSKSILNVLRL